MRVQIRDELDLLLGLVLAEEVRVDRPRGDDIDGDGAGREVLREHARELLDRGFRGYVDERVGLDGGGGRQAGGEEDDAAAWTRAVDTVN